MTDIAIDGNQTGIVGASYPPHGISDVPPAGPDLVGLAMLCAQRRKEYHDAKAAAAVATDALAAAKAAEEAAHKANDEAVASLIAAITSEVP